MPCADPRGSTTRSPPAPYWWPPTPWARLPGSGQGPQPCGLRAVPPDVLEKIIARIPRGRLGKAEDIARGVVFLTAEDADFITGSTLSINGGQHMY